MEMIVMSGAEAGTVTGPTANGHALAPRALADGLTLVLPLAVLTDPAHAVHHQTLATFQTREVAAEEFPSAEE